MNPGPLVATVAFISPITPKARNQYFISGTIDFRCLEDCVLVDSEKRIHELLGEQSAEES